MKNKRYFHLPLLVGAFALAVHCTATTGTTSSLASATYSTTSGTVTPTTATLDATSGCVTNVNTTMDSSLPSWIKDNFKCQVAYVSGTNYVFKAIGIPNHKSYYYCSSQTKNGGCTGTKGPLWEALASTHTCSGSVCTPNPDNNTNYGAGTNIISTQNFVMTVPSSPTAASGTLTSTQAGQSIIGITVNGISIFNNSAAPPDTLATQAFTFDNYGGHPDGTNIYHHHSEVTKVSSSMATGALIGIMGDGYAVYDEKCDQNDGSGAKTLTYNSSAAVGNSSTDSAGSSSTQLDRLHGHTTTTKHFSTATYHYHYSRDATAENAISGSTLSITTTANGTSSNVKTLVGAYFRGVPGTSSN